MAVSFSENQKKAIETRGKSLVLSASAGSGKTTVLVERVLRLVCEEKISLENLAVVTFTNAAAAGIKDKLRKALNERLSNTPADEHIRKQLLLLPDADISTVHSFCGRLIKKYSHVLKRDIPSSAKLLSDTEDKLLKQETAEELFDECYSQGDDRFINFIEFYSPGRNDDNLIKLILSVYEYVCSIPFYDEWIDNSIKAFSSGEDFDNTPMGIEIRAELDKILYSAISKYAMAIEFTESDEGLSKQTDTYKSELNQFKKAYSAQSFKEKTEILNTIPFKTLPAAKRGTDTSVSSGIRDRVKAKIKEFREEFSTWVMPDEKNLDALKMFFELIMKFDEFYKDKKYRKGNISFMDQEHLAIEILENDEISAELKNKYYEVMVDEFQDTNSVQDYIFEKIAKENNLFTVGDVKQSIYRFRHADPSVFTARINKGKNSSDTETIYLNENFRSSDNVASFANHIFSYIMNRETSFTDYRETDLLIPKKNAVSDIYAPEVVLCDASASAEEGVTSGEAAYIAEKIENIILDRDFLIGAEKRRVKYSDIVILTRSFNEKTLKFLSELTELGVPCRYDDKINLFDTAEIKTVLALLKVTDNPLDDISLIAVLRNIFNLSDAEIFEMRRNCPNREFYEVIKKERADIYNYLKDLRLFGIKYPLSDVVEKIYDDFLLPEKWTAMFTKTRKDNLMKLLNLASEFEETGFKGISAFIKYIDKIISTKEKLPSSDNLFSSDNDYVRVMTVHKSKGLEFPVVFLSGCGTKFNKRDMADPVLTDSALGVGCMNIDLEKRIKTSTLFRDIIAKKELCEMLSEEMRLLYVALTRAEYKIIVTGSVNNLAKRLEAYSDATYNSRFKLSYLDFLKAGCFLDFIMPPLMFVPGISDFGINIPLELKDSSADINVKFSIYDKEGVKKEKEEENLSELRYEIPDMKYEETARVFSYESPYMNMPKKISVTALNNMNENSSFVYSTAPELYVPDFNENAKMSVKRRGTMIHYIFEKINLEKLKNGKDVLGAVEELMQKNSVVFSNITVDDLRKVEEFFKNPIGIKMLRSNKILREKEFLIQMDSKDVYGGRAGKKITVQGIIDCCFWDNMGELWLIDYKYTTMSEEKIKETYKYQLELYKTALSKIMNVDPSHIHSVIWDINRSVSYKI